MARQPVVRPDSAETRLNHDPPASAEVALSQRSGHPSGQSPASTNGAARSSSAAALDEVLKLVAEQACLATSASASAVAIAEGNEIICRATAGPYAPELGARLDTSSGLTGACVHFRQIQYCEDTETDSRVNSAACRRLQVRSVLVVPLLSQDELLGIVEIFSPFPQAFARHDLQNLEALSRVIVDNLKSADDSVLLPVDDEPLFASSHQSWSDAPAVPALELSAIRWEPAEPTPDFLEAAPPAETSASDSSYSEPRVKELSPHREFLIPPAPPQSRVSVAPPPMAAAVSEPEFEPPSSPSPEPEPPARVAVSPTNLRPAISPRRRDWTTNFLTFTVIGVALLLGWMLGRAGWQHVLGVVRPVAASSTKSGSSSLRPTADPANPPAVDVSDAVFPSSAKSVPSPPRARTPLPSKSASDPQPDGGLVVYEGGHIIFQQNATHSKPGPLAKSPDAARQPLPGPTGGSSGDPVSLSPELASTYLLHRVEPVYPEESRQRNVEGEVHLEALVGRDGSVQVLRLISGDSGLAQAAADAVRQWRFRPYRSDGKPEPFSTRLTVSFRLQ